MRNSAELFHHLFRTALHSRFFIPILQMRTTEDYGSCPDDENCRSPWACQVFQCLIHMSAPGSGSLELKPNGGRNDAHHTCHGAWHMESRQPIVVESMNPQTLFSLFTDEAVRNREGRSLTRGHPGIEWQSWTGPQVLPLPTQPACPQSPRTHLKPDWPQLSSLWTFFLEMFLTLPTLRSQCSFLWFTQIVPSSSFNK